LTLPRLDEYQLAVQNPRNAFKDPNLKSCKVETNPLGLPAVKSGGFALIYHLSRKEQWAVRCFYREIGDLRYRYDAISRFLDKNANGTFVKATLQPDGILVGGNYYPILVMPWLVGDVLNLHIERNNSKPSEIGWLPDAFLRMVNDLERLGVAHGDLQHGNIMVRNNALTLIDYDGMYLPELSNSPAKVLGHLNYIHPERPNVAPSLQIDRFPSIVIYLGLRAVAAVPAVWKKYSDGENILFQRKDFLDPLSSPLIRDLKKIPSLATLAEKFQAICFLDFNKIPSLSEFISPSYVPPKPIARPRPAPTIAKIPIEYITQYEVVLAGDRSALIARVGEKLEVVGQITDYKKGITRRNQPYMFLNFGDWRKKAFCLVMWADGLDMMQASGVRPDSLVRKWVSVTGMITEYNGRPQLVVEIPSQIQPLSGNQEAVRRVKTQRRAGATPPTSPKQKPAPQMVVQQVVPTAQVPRPVPVPTPQPTSKNVMTRQDAQTLGRLYGTYRPSPPSHAPPSQSRPTISPRAGQTIPSPGLFAGGVLLILTAIAVAAFRIYLLSLFLAIVGLPVTYYALTHCSTLEPVQVMSYTSTNARFVGRCRGCGRLIQKGSAIVKTDRGWMHLQCTSSAKKRVWRRA
jgi:hypothetical protein